MLVLCGGLKAGGLRRGWTVACSSHPQNLITAGYLFMERRNVLTLLDVCTTQIQENIRDTDKTNGFTSDASELKKLYKK